MKALGTLILASGLIAVAPASRAADMQPIPVPYPNEPKVSYTILAIEKDAQYAAGLRVTARRIGPSGTSFTLREVDCGTARFRYLAEGDAADKLAPYPQLGNMSPLLKGSSSYETSRIACIRTFGKFSG